MKQLKKKKGFTLVELIVVIAIIAILAAVAVPTTMHFVEKAHESNDKAAINIIGNIGALFDLASTGTSTDVFNMAETAKVNDNGLATKLAEDPGTATARSYIKNIVFTFEAVPEAAGSYKVKAVITGKNEAKKDQTVEGYVAQSVTPNQICYKVDNNATIVANCIITFNFTSGKVSSVTSTAGASGGANTGVTWAPVA